MPKDKKYDIGVIIGRFQVHELHKGHIALIENVLSNHKKVIVFLGISPVLCTRNNPLDYESRAKMIREKFSDLVIAPIKDINNDEKWSAELDRRIKEIFPIGSAVLYGSRDSFIPHYKGKYKTLELEQEVFVSGTEVRKTASSEIKADVNFRSGVIYAAYNQYPRVFPTVDVVPIKGNKFILAKKPAETKYRFVGGFCDPDDKSFEASAKRELIEEIGDIEVSDFEYITSQRVEDWRYASEVDSIITTLFACSYMWGRIEPRDDISEARWFTLKEFETAPGMLDPEKLKTLIVPEHINLFVKFSAYMVKRTKIK